MKNTFLLALAIVVVTSLWMFSGQFKEQEHHDLASENLLKGNTNGQSSGSGEKPIARVRTAMLTAEMQALEVVVRGRTEAKRLVEVKAETGGRVIAVPVEKGQRVKAGQLLCELDENGRRAQLAQAQATVDKARIDYQGANKLLQKQLISSSGLAASKAQLAQAEATLRNSELEIQHLQMRAPFDGFVEARPANIGDLFDRGSVCAQIMDERTILATGYASEREISQLRLGQSVRVTLQNEATLDGKISFISRNADPATRTYRIEAELDGTQHPLRDGITAQIAIPLQQVLAHRITPSVLALDDAGRIGVRIINDQNIVEFHLIHIARETKDGIWVTGLPQTINLITVGQELVADGDTVQTSNDTTSRFGQQVNHTVGD